MTDRRPRSASLTLTGSNIATKSTGGYSGGALPTAVALPPINTSVMSGPGQTRESFKTAVFDRSRIICKNGISADTRVPCVFGIKCPHLKRGFCYAYHFEQEFNKAENSEQMRDVFVQANIVMMKTGTRLHHANMERIKLLDALDGKTTIAPEDREKMRNALRFTQQEMDKQAAYEARMKGKKEVKTVTNAKALKSTPRNGWETPNP